MAPTDKAKAQRELDALLAEAARPAEERRRYPRRDLRIKVDFVPLQPAGPNYDAAIPAETRNISSDGIALVLESAPLSPRWLVRLPTGEQGTLLEVSVRHIQRLETGKLFLACQFIRRLEE